MIKMLKERLQRPVLSQAYLDISKTSAEEVLILHTARYFVLKFFTVELLCSSSFL